MSYEMMIPMIPMVQRDGTLLYVPRSGVSNGLGDFFSFLSKGSGVVASGAGAAVGSSLIAAGTTAAAVVPVIGAIAGAVAIVAGLIANQRAKTKAIKSSLADAETQRVELMRQNNELDQAIYNTAASAQTIIDQIRKITGSQPQQLNGFNDWLKKTFTPAKYYGEKIEQAATDIDSLTAQAEGKINILSSMQSELQQLADTLTEGKNLQVLKKVLLYGGISVAAGYGLYELIKYLRS
jgi:hypothetical protein